MYFASGFGLENWQSARSTCLWNFYIIEAKGFDHVNTATHAAEIWPRVENHFVSTTACKYLTY